MSNIKEQFVQKITTHFNVSLKSSVAKMAHPGVHIYPAGPQLKKLKNNKYAIEYSLMTPKNEIVGVDYFFISETFFNELVGPNGVIS